MEGTKKAIAWSKNTNIYEVNIRQYTQEGTFRAFEKHLPRLKEMGVNTIWLMPIHPVGVKNRKGSLGSHYAVKNYLDVNPDYGTMDDFKHLVKATHHQGMHIVIDWVANHTAWDNVWLESHKDWYTLDANGNPKPPVDDWTDVADLNYDNPQMREAMIDALKFWVQQTDIDGYRCDVSDMVPLDFWDKVRAELDKIKPVFMLAESELPNQHDKAFDMTYAWELHHLMNSIAKGEKTAQDLDIYFSSENYKRFKKADYRMQFTSNHDENSWNGTEYERLKSPEAVRCFGVFAATVPGMLLIYNGQEDSLARRLKFFDKDAIQWGYLPLAHYYKTLLNLKKKNPALWNGEYGGEMIRITSDNANVYAYKRIKEEHEVVVVLNLSNSPQKVHLNEKLGSNLQEVFTQEEATSDLELEHWGYKVFATK